MKKIVIFLPCPHLTQTVNSISNETWGEVTLSILPDIHCNRNAATYVIFM